MPEACEVTIDIAAHIYGGNIRRRAGSSRSYTDVYFHIIVKKMPGAGITHAGQMLINSQQVCFVARVVHAINIHMCRLSPGCPQSYDDTAGNACDLVAAVIVKIPVSEALRD